MTEHYHNFGWKLIIMIKYDDCEYCGGAVKGKNIRMDYRFKGNLVIIEGVPVGVCAVCGERYYVLRCSNKWRR